MTIDEMIACGAGLEEVLAAAKSKVNSRDKAAQHKKEVYDARNKAAEYLVKYLELTGTIDKGYDWHEMARIMEESENEMRETKQRQDRILNKLSKAKDMSLEEMLTELKKLSEAFNQMGGYLYSTICADEMNGIIIKLREKYQVDVNFSQYRPGRVQFINLDKLIEKYEKSGK